MKIAIICGGAGAERGVSINSARSVMDHLQSDDVEIVPFYFDVFMNIYLLSTAQLYSNTPSDFDFKLKNQAQKISQDEFIERLKNLDLAFPLIHGIFGEDGELQQLLEDNNIPYVGGSASAYRTGFPKDSANKILKDNGFETIPFESLNRRDLTKAKDIVERFFKEQKISRAIVKPVLGGSSIGTYSVYNADEAVSALQDSVELGLNVGDTFIIEPFCKGREFTSIVVENCKGEPVAFVPTEIELVKGDDLFNFRKKYLPTDSSRLHCPPRFTEEQIETIQGGAEKLFKLFGFHDYLRIDGWVLDNGKIIFSDINPVTGMEQCSFVFEQTSRVGFTHASILHMLVENACRRYGKEIPQFHNNIADRTKKNVFILMGGRTAERQVSLMSGTNVWLKLMKSKDFTAVPYLFDKQGFVWKLPYSFALNHTVEEIYQNCLEADRINAKLDDYAEVIYKKLNLPNPFKVANNTPRKMTLDDFCQEAKDNQAFVFVGLHGGEGENGSLQKKLESYDLVYNVSDSKASRICMDKCVTGELINEMQDPDIISLPKRQFNAHTVTKEELQQIWQEVSKYTNGEFDSFAIKPLSDGCSSGIIRIYSFDELWKYVNIVGDISNDVIPANTFHNQVNEVALPQDRNPIYFIEPFVQVDYIRVIKNDIVYKKINGWLEFTVGVMEKSGEYHSFNPSITIAEGEVLSLEEKFQGGTGVNITPPPEDLLSLELRDKVKFGIEKVAKALGIKSYARIDIFVNLATGKIAVIEANSLPGMTPSTVIYHQALSEKPAMYPIQFIEKIIRNKMESVVSPKMIPSKIICHEKSGKKQEMNVIQGEGKSCSNKIDCVDN